jgi:TatA/E family protein of Tat protein translocase
LPEILFILLVILLIFGAAKLPEIGRSLGEAIRAFKKGVQDDPDRRGGSDGPEDMRK